LVGLQPDIILVSSGSATVAVQRETRTIPIVFAVIVTLRNRSEVGPTSPTTQVAAPLDWTVSTRIGSLKSGPMRVWPTINGGLWPVMLRPYAA
jgi:hypothetical protein